MIIQDNHHKIQRTVAGTLAVLKKQMLALTVLVCGEGDTRSRATSQIPALGHLPRDPWPQRHQLWSSPNTSQASPGISLYIGLIPHSPLQPLAEKALSANPEPREHKGYGLRTQTWVWILTWAFFPMATPAAYEGSQARSIIRVTVETYTTATATPDPSHICDLHHSLQQHQILNWLSQASDQTHFLTKAIPGP